jgi:tryptophanyl-tRNA synthetase
MSELHNRSSRPRVLSGMRPTGKLHLGNYMGALANWVKLQDEEKYDCYFFIADYHALTTDYADPSRLKLNTLDVALDWLAAGLDPEKSTIFIQSHVPQHAELHLLFSMITPLGWLERVPTYKEQQENLTGKDLSTYGFLGYPLLQAADILLYQADYVPVGQDQVAHVELTREVARRFNSMYRSSIFPLPETLLTPAPKLPGTDGRKMSKSYGNTIGLTEPDSVVITKIDSMPTNRARTTDPGDPDLCPVGDLHKVFSFGPVAAATQVGCRTATIPCRECKSVLADSILQRTAPIRAQRQELEAKVDKVWDLLMEESGKAEIRAEATMKWVRDTLGISRGIGDVKDRFGVAEPHDGGVISGSDVSYVINTLGESGSWRTWAECVPQFRIHWWRKMVPREIDLKRPAEGFGSEERYLEEPFMTPSGKRLLVRVCDQSPGVHMTEQGIVRTWSCDIPQRTYEVWVLLTYEGESVPLRYSTGSCSGTLSAFIVPQRIFSRQFAQARKALAKNQRVSAKVMRDQSNHYFLQIGASNYTGITSMQNNYEPLT